MLNLSIDDFLCSVVSGWSQNQQHWQLVCNHRFTKEDSLHVGRNCQRRWIPNFQKSVISSRWFHEYRNDLISRPPPCYLQALIRLISVLRNNRMFNTKGTITVTVITIRCLFSLEELCTHLDIAVERLRQRPLFLSCGIALCLGAIKGRWTSVDTFPYSEDAA